jgi:hypothetical protein
LSSYFNKIVYFWLIFTKVIHIKFTLIMAKLGLFLFSSNMISNERNAAHKTYFFINFDNQSSYTLMYFLAYLKEI